MIRRNDRNDSAQLNEKSLNEKSIVLPKVNEARGRFHLHPNAFLVNVRGNKGIQTQTHLTDLAPSPKKVFVLRRVLARL